MTITNRIELRLAEHGLAERPVPEHPAHLAVTPEDESNSKVPEQLDAWPAVRMPSALRLYVVEVPPEQEPPIPEDDIISETVVDQPVIEDVDPSSEGGGKVSIQTTSKVESKATDTTKVEMKNGKLVKTEDGQVVGEEMEIDDWLFDFAQLFRNHVGKFTVIFNCCSTTEAADVYRRPSGHNLTGWICRHRPRWTRGLPRTWHGALF